MVESVCMWLIRFLVKLLIFLVWWWVSEMIDSMFVSVFFIWWLSLWVSEVWMLVCCVSYLSIMWFFVVCLVKVCVKMSIRIEMMILKVSVVWDSFERNCGFFRFVLMI